MSGHRLKQTDLSKLGMLGSHVYRKTGSGFRIKEMVRDRHVVALGPSACYLRILLLKLLQYSLHILP